MNEGSVFATFVVVFREALEAGLILGIVLTVLNRLGAGRYASHVLLSSALALGLSFAVGAWLSGLADAAQDRAGKLIEGVISLVASAVLTYMFFWMAKQAQRIKPEIEAKLEAALTSKDYFAVLSLPFFAVLREGAETVLFLKAVSIQSGGSVSLWGGLLGLGLALTITMMIFMGGKRVPLKPLFRATGFLILFIAAGLLSYGVHELEEAGLIPQFIYPLYNINFLLNEKEGVGSFLKAIFGYNGNPSLTETLVYWSYLSLILLCVRKNRQTA